MCEHHDDDERDDDEKPARRPGPWVICSVCSGDGAHSRNLGVIDRDDWSPEEFEDYLAGLYDQTCEACGGSGKVREEDNGRNLFRRLQLDRGLNEDGEPIGF